MRRQLLVIPMLFVSACLTNTGGGGGGAQGGAVGSACKVGSDCGGDLSCHAGLPGGYCLSPCGVSCPSGSTCTRYNGQEFCMQSCEANTDCRDGYECKAGTCQPPCVTDHDCAAGSACQGGACIEGGVGAACVNPSDCAPGSSCIQGLPGGYCTQPCGSASCPTGTECVTLGGADYCFDSCLASSECRSGYVCSNGICDKACGSDQDCAGGEMCIDSACVGAGVGQACISGSDCPNALSCYKGIPAGYCTDACTSGADCPQGSTCGNLRGSRMCVAACRMDVDCGAGQRCFAGTCEIPCTVDSDCLEGYCDTGTGQCRGAVGGGGNTEVIDLGTVVPGSRQSIPVDAQTFAFTISAVGVNSASYAIDSVRKPDGTELVSRDLWSGKLRVSPGRGYGAITVPNSDDSILAMTPGTWTFDIVSDRGSTAHVFVFLKKSSTGRAVGGTIPLHIYLAPGAIPGVSSANAASNSHIQEALNRFRHFYRDQAGISLSAVSYGDVPSQYSDINSDTEYGDMFSRYAQDGELSVFWVRSLTLGGQADVAGVAGGIPGPPRAGGTVSSGVVVEAQQYARITGDDMAHEVGHFQGLYHTSEMDGRTNDLLTDTPVCPDIYRCNAGYYHLMFPALTGAQDTLSPHSVTVVQGNAVSD